MMAKAHRGNNTSCNGNYQTRSSTGIIEIAVDEVEDDHEVEDFVLHVFGFQKLYGHHMHGTAGCLRNGVRHGAILQMSFKPATIARSFELRKDAIPMYLQTKAVQLRGKQRARLSFTLKAVDTMATAVMFKSTQLHQLAPDNTASEARGDVIE